MLVMQGKPNFQRITGVTSRSRPQTWVLERTEKHPHDLTREKNSFSTPISQMKENKGVLEIGPAPINSEKRPQADTSLSRPVWPQFCFYPLRIIPQGTQSQGLRMWSVFGGVENSMFLGLC